jgi:hypothetical protein
MRKTNYHKLAAFVEQVDPEVVEVLDALVSLASFTSQSY